MKRQWNFLVGLGLVGLLALSAQAGTGGARKATLSGKLVCLGCTLAKTEGAAAQCSSYGHRHVLQTADGKFWSFLENDRSEPLIKGGAFHNQQVTVHGRIYPAAQTIEVESFEVGGKKYEWCAKCKSMAPPHKH